MFKSLILLKGHTHKFEAFEHEQKFYINPGSATGAYNALDRYTIAPIEEWTMHVMLHGGSCPHVVMPVPGEHFFRALCHVCSFHNACICSDVSPSFVLLDIQQSTVVAYVYQLIDSEVKVERIEYKKS